MTKKIDELFSPERLRRNWQKAKVHPEELAGSQTEAKSPQAIFARLQALIRDRFSGDDAVALNLLLEELQVLLDPVFPEAGKSQTPATDQAKMIPQLHEILNRIEDIVEAFEIGNSNRQRQ
jgi:hypothetical protein